MSRKDFFASLDRAAAGPEPFAVVTVIETVGSAPREVGAKMLVHCDGSIDGTIGGGVLEALATREAILAIEEGRPRRRRFNLGARSARGIGMFCGGEVEVFIDVVAREATLVLLGGGHVSEAIGRMAAVVGLPTVVADDRPEFASALRFPAASRVVCGDLPAAMDELPIDGSSYLVIVTRCHTIDMECLARALSSQAPYIGMIGSVAKTRQVYKLLAERGIDPTRDPRVYAPIGLDVGTDAPGEIAVSVLAEVLMVKNGREARHRRLAAVAPPRRVRAHGPP